MNRIQEAVEVLVAYRHVEHDVVLVYRDKCLSVDRVREACQLQHAVQLVFGIVLRGLAVPCRAVQVHLYLVLQLNLQGQNQLIWGE